MLWIDLHDRYIAAMHSTLSSQVAAVREEASEQIRLI
jgi:hypothetical protein